MLLKELELKNFRQYEGEQRIEFSTDPVKNVTLILGKNTSGKTTLIQAFRWVLYRDLNFTDKASNPNAVINENVRKGMRAGDTEYVSAKLTMQHGGVIYEVERSFKYTCKISGDGRFNDETFKVFYSDANGNMMPLRDSISKIDEILPEELSEYFFFDGEKIAKSRERSNVKTAINSIMGLTPIEKMIEHLAGGKYDRSTSDNVIKVLEGSKKDSSQTRPLRTKIEGKESEINSK